jgi:Phosphatidylinositol 3- and 4-kinase
MIVLRAVTAALLCASSLAVARQMALPPSIGSKIWVDRHKEMEDYLRTAECVKMEGLNANIARCTFPPGGLVARMVWRALPPGVHRGFRESYKTEIAAYELDKLLKMDMVPPTVERQLEGHSGAAQLWVENVSDMRTEELPPDARRADWDAQLARMKMFDDLIGNRDRNLANMLRDPSWNLVLIDHGQAFGSDTKLYYKLTRIDKDLWAKIESLKPAQVDTALRDFVSDAERKAMFKRRDTIRAEIKQLLR